MPFSHGENAAHACDPIIYYKNCTLRFSGNAAFWFSAYAREIWKVRSKKFTRKFKFSREETKDF